MYGAPEYGGNRNLAGWRYTNWPGDSQPAGFSAAQVSGPAANGRSLSAAKVASLERFLPGLAGARFPNDAHWRPRRRRLLGP
jgi:hypothetical protein